MDAKTFERAVYEACLHAARTLGPRVKGMSCFLHNWKQIKIGPEAKPEKQAA